MIRQLINFAITAVYTAILFPIAVLISLLKWDWGAGMWLAREAWAPPQLFLARADLKISGQQNVDPKRPTIYVCNHQSTIDIIVLLRAIPMDFKFIAKASLRWVPFLGWYLWLAGHVLVDRGNSQRAIASLDKAARRIQNGISIVVFGEGTRSSDGKILPFKKGPFLLALKAGVAVVPVTIEGSWRVMPKNSWDVKPGTIHVKIGEPIDASKFALEQREEFIRKVRDVIIDQSLEVGGPGGDKTRAIAPKGKEGLGQANDE
ncbi:MAG: lysophospholipid acyltransferase family protein [Myxococcaceae bacterium]